MSVCGFIKASGERCRAQAMKESQWCYVHDPALEDKRQRNNSKGGRRGGKGRPSTVLQRLQARLEELAEMVLEGEVEQDLASTAGRLLNYSGNQMKNYLAAREAEELEARVYELEEALERQKAQERRSSMRDKIRRLQKAMQGSLEAIEQRDGSTYYFDPSEACGQMFDFWAGSVEADYRREPRPEPPEVLVAVSNAKDRERALERVMGDYSFLPVEVEPLIAEGEIIPRSVVVGEEYTSEPRETES